jgi:hypothetical protein
VFCGFHICKAVCLSRYVSKAVLVATSIVYASPLTKTCAQARTTSTRLAVLYARQACKHSDTTSASMSCNAQRKPNKENPRVTQKHPAAASQHYKKSSAACNRHNQDELLQQHNSRQKQHNKRKGHYLCTASLLNDARTLTVQGAFLTHHKTPAAGGNAAQHACWHACTMCGR